MHRPASRTFACLLASCALACGARTVAEDDGDTVASTSTSTGTSTDTSTESESGSESETGPIEDTGGLPPGLSCECVDLDASCALTGVYVPCDAAQCGPGSVCDGQGQCRPIAP